MNSKRNPKSTDPNNLKCLLTSSSSVAVLPAWRRGWRWPRQASGFACSNRSRISAGGLARFAIPPPARLWTTASTSSWAATTRPSNSSRPLELSTGCIFSPASPCRFWTAMAGSRASTAPTCLRPGICCWGCCARGVFRSSRNWKCCAWEGPAHAADRTLLLRRVRASRRGSAGGDNRKAFSAISGICSASRR